MCAVSGERTSAAQMQRQVIKGQAPKGVTRVDAGRADLKVLDHIHFGEGFRALNFDGT